MEDRREFLINQACLSASDALAVDSDDPDTPLAGDPTSITVRSETTLVVEKTDESVGDADYVPGSQVRYRIRIGRRWHAAGAVWWSQTSFPTASAS